MPYRLICYPLPVKPIFRRHIFACGGSKTPKTDDAHAATTQRHPSSGTFITRHHLCFDSHQTVISVKHLPQCMQKWHSSIHFIPQRKPVPESRGTGGLYWPVTHQCGLPTLLPSHPIFYRKEASGSWFWTLSRALHHRTKPPTNGDDLLLDGVIFRYHRASAIICAIVVLKRTPRRGENTRQITIFSIVHAYKPIISYTDRPISQAQQGLHTADLLQQLRQPASHSWHNTHIIDVRARRS